MTLGPGYNCEIQNEILIDVEQRKDDLLPDYQHVKGTEELELPKFLDHACATCPICTLPRLSQLFPLQLVQGFGKPFRRHGAT